MAEWWTYTADDFLMFGPQTYWRLFELNNRAVWPLQPAAIAAGIAALVLALRPRPWSGRAIAALIGAAWIWVGWSFLLRTYAPVNWAAAYLAPLFFAEGLAFISAGVLQERLRFAPGRDAPAAIGIALYGYALALHPLTALAAGRPAAAAEIVGVAPDPTAIATLGLMAMSGRGKTTALLMVVPALWCAVSGATLLALAASEAWLPLAALGLAVVARFWRGHGPRPHD